MLICLSTLVSSTISAQSTIGAIDLSASVHQGASVEIELLASGSVAPSFEIVAPPLFGILTGTPPTVTYTAPPDHHGNDLFTYRVLDGTDVSETATVDIFVSADVARGRPQLIGNDVRADNGLPLRGEALAFGPWNLTKMYDLAWWTEIRDVFHLNTVRLFMYRPPQNYSGGPGVDCDQCLDLDQLIDGAATTLDVLDDMVEIAGGLGMYLIIDYHPVGGHDVADALAWWPVVADRYRDRTHVIYELANEPVAWSASAYQPDDVQFEEDLFAVIRAAAPETHIILWTFAHMTGNMREKVDEGTEIDYANASVGFHAYLDNLPGALELRSFYPAIQTEIGSTLGAGTAHENLVDRTADHESHGFSWVWLNGAFTTGATGGPTDGLLPSEVTWTADPAATGDFTDATPPPTPDSVAAVDVSETAATLTWSPVIDSESGITNYRVRRDGQLIAIPTSPSFVDVDLTAGCTHEYAVTAINGVGLESVAASNLQVVTLLPCAAGSSAVMTCVSDGAGIDLEWILGGAVDSLELEVSRNGLVESTLALSGDAESYTYPTTTAGTYVFTLATLCGGSATGAPTFCIVDHDPPTFRRGDANTDGTVDLGDVITALAYLFDVGASPICLAAADANDDEQLDIADALFLLNFLHLGGSAPSSPYPDCGLDTSSLDCASFTACP
ncbi:MAG: cellulase family glycosylhydrolase [Planctomycetes bacterium]|nr:cellulase family glycosylhydrolase [Planctomycetota bacterium]